MRKFLTTWVCFSFLLLGGILYAESPAEFPSDEPVSVNLIVEDESIQPGRPFWVGIRMNIDKDWHAYWKNPGDSGMALSVDWLLPPGFEAGPLLWPTPQKFTLDSMVGFGYDAPVMFLTQITPSADLSNTSTATIAADVRWVACSDVTCLPGEGGVNASLKISVDQPRANPTLEKDFTSARAQIPAQHDGIKVEQNQEGMIELVVNDKYPHSPTSAYFFPEEEAIDYKADTLIHSSENQHKITLKGNDSLPENLKGVLIVESDKFKKAYEVNSPIKPRQQSVAHHSEFEGGIALALAFALLGGMILNLMPCVLPVLSFKVLSFVKMAGQDRKLILKHGLAFSVGVLVSFWALAGVLLALKAYGHSVGWGFQLQEPLFVAILAAILFAFGLSLFGLFELGTSVTSAAGQIGDSGKKEGLSASFLSGVLATAVATPCTGPFLGSAVGFAFTLPAIGALAIFTALGIGMSLPYLILAAFPKLLKFLPRPGAWMVAFKELMGFLMMASVLWLIWVFSAQTSNLSLMLLLVSFFFLGIGGWIYGKWGTPFRKKTVRYVGYTLTLGCLAIAGMAIINSVSSQTAIAEEQLVAETDSWEKFSPERVEELRKQGIPVFIDFTAKWCLICQANHLVLKTFDVTKEFVNRGVVKMKADWTKKDPVITEELRKHGRSGVPLYLLYGPNPKTPPQILPQVLTPDIVIDSIKKLDAKA